MNPARFTPFIIVAGALQAFGAVMSAMPWWAPLAGLTGAVAVFAGLALIDQLGAGMVNGLIIAANLATSLLIDHFGLVNAPTHGPSVRRVTGAVLIAAGVSLISKF